MAFKVNDDLEFEIGGLCSLCKPILSYLYSCFGHFWHNSEINSQKIATCRPAAAGKKLHPGRAGSLAHGNLGMRSVGTQSPHDARDRGYDPGTGTLCGMKNVRIFTLRWPSSPSLPSSAIWIVGWMAVRMKDGAWKSGKRRGA